MARLIKRYENRKLYDTQASAYVSQSDIASLIRQGETVAVIDLATEKDITAQILTQIILEEGKRGNTTISTETLHDLVRRSGKALDSGIEQIKHSVDDLVQSSLGRVNKLIHGEKPSELRQLRDQLSSLESLLTKVIGDKQNDTEEAKEEG